MLPPIPRGTSSCQWLKEQDAPVADPLPTQTLIIPIGIYYLATAGTHITMYTREGVIKTNKLKKGRDKFSKGKALVTTIRIIKRENMRVDD